MMIEKINRLLNVVLAENEIKLRPGSQSVNINEFNNIDLSNYSETIKCLKSGYIFIRYSNVEADMLIQDPKQYHRKPLSLKENKTNYHEFYIDCSPEWSRFPKRYNSLMFTTHNFNTLKTNVLENKERSVYGKNAFYVFPENNSKLALSPTSDFIYSFHQLNIDDLYRFNSLLNVLYQSITGKPFSGEGGIENYAEWDAKLKEMQIKYNEMTPDQKFLVYDIVNKVAKVTKISTEFLINDIFAKCEFKEFIEEVCGPAANDFISISCNYNRIAFYFYTLREYWTDGKCLMINVKAMDQVRSKLIDSLGEN